MKESLGRALYIGALIAAPICLVGIAYHFGAPAHHALDPIVRPASGAERLEPIQETKPAKAPWVCPMHAHILQDHPGSCPICGMDLVEADDGDATEGAGIRVDAATRQRLGVRLAHAELRALSREVQTFGNVAIDESSIVNVSPKIDGWIRKLHVAAVGQPVRAGQVLYEIYSPELVQRQREYIELLQRRDQLLQSMKELSGQNAQVAASFARERMRSREKFANADVDAQTLDALEKGRRPLETVTVRAARSGFVTQIGAREGAYVTPMVNLVSIAAVDTVWIDIVLYPDQLAWVREGDAVTVRLPRSDQPIAKGRLKFASPIADNASRTVQARLAVSNPGGLLRPGMLVDVSIASDPHQGLLLPRSAVMRTGTGSRVMLARGEGHFMPVPVETGIETGDFVEIVDGLQEGATVAVNGQFLLDAAASMSDAAQRMRHDH